MIRFLSFISLLLFLPTVQLLAQNINGSIKDDKNEPVIGAAVSINGTNKGVSSDLDGNFSLKDLAAGKYTLQISALGFAKQTHNIDLSSGQDLTLSIILKEDALQLDQVVVVGYGLEQKRDVTGSISTVKAKEINNTVQSSFEQALQGRAAGVQVTAASGMAGSPVKINIRGTNSISAGSQPLYVVDGIPVTTGDFSPGNLGSRTNALADINPADIETVEILKDAAAAAIYGSRGANGVVLITTKKGKGGQTKFDAGYSFGYQSPTNLIDYMNGAKMLELRDKASIDLKGRPESKDSTVVGQWNNLPFTRAQADSFVSATGGSDWIGATIRRGTLMQANLSASGGNDKTTFYIGGTYRNEQGFLLGNSFERTNGKIAIENKAFENLSIGVNSNLSYSINNRIPTGSSGGFGLAQLKMPYIPIYDKDGTYNDPRSNPLWQLENMHFTARVFRAISEVHADWKIIDGLNLRSSLGTDVLTQNENEFNFRNEKSLDTSDVSNAWDRRTFVLNWTNSNYITYTHKFNDHDVSVMAGNETQESKRNGVGLYGEKFPNDYFTQPGDAVVKNGYSYTTRWTFASFFGRINYKLKEKYLLSASMRYDGSSRFGNNNKWGAFPGVSAGWILSEESFIKKISIISFLKLRASYGVTGNANIGDFASLGYYSSSNGYNGWSAIVPNTLSNPDLRWEKSNQFDVNMDIAFWKNRFAAGINYYYKTSNDLLLNISVPTSSGYALILQNKGKLENKGLEITLNTKNIDKKFTWYTDFNIAFNRNKVLDVEGLEPDAFDDKNLGNRGGEGRVIENYPVGQFYVVEWAGVQQTEGSLQLWNADGSPKLDASGNPIFVNDPAGTELFKDKYGNLMTFANPTGGEFYGENRKPMGNPLPRFIGGFGNTFTYKGFELNFLFNFVYGNQIYDDAAKTQIGSWKNINQRTEIEDAYTSGNPSSNTPALYNNSGSSNASSDYVAVNSSRWLYDASYLRLRTLTFSYSFSEAKLKKVKLTGLRIFINGGNLYTLTKFPGMDPEVLRNVDPDSERGNIAFGGPYLGTPQAKTITAGINLKF